MLYLLSFLSGWLVGSLLLGLAMGWIAVVHRARTTSRVVARWLAALAVVLVAAALTHVIQGSAGYWLVDLAGLERASLDLWWLGRVGYWLDLGLIMFACYLIGCAVGSWLRDWVVSRTAPTA